MTYVYFDGSWSSELLQKRHGAECPGKNDCAGTASVISRRSSSRNEDPVIYAVEEAVGRNQE